MKRVETLGRRRGLALLAAVAAISLVGVLALASTRLAVGRMTGARRATAVHAAALAATRLLDSIAAAARPARWDLLTPGVPLTLLDAPGRERVVLTRVGDLLHRLDAAVERGDALAPARRAQSLLLRADVPRLERGAPIVAAGAVTIASDFAVDVTADAGCARAAATAHVVAADSTRVRWEATSDAGRVVEDAVLREPASFARDASRMRASAELLLDPGAEWRPLADTAVAVAAAGDLTLGPGQGRGTLLVEGRLTIVGPLRWNGVILALGGITTIGAGVDLLGALASGGDVRLAAGTLRHDACVARAALLHAARFHPVREWSRASLP